MTVLMSIDVGVVNMGLCCVEAETGKVLWAEKVGIARSMRELRGEAQIVTRLWTLFFGDEVSQVAKWMRAAEIVLIENQMKRKMLIVQHAIAAMCAAQQKRFEFCPPQKVKSHFGTGYHARQKQLKYAHRQNKKDAVKKAAELFPKFMARLSANKKDDVADALLQASWYCAVYIKSSAASEEARAKCPPVT